MIQEGEVMKKLCFQICATLLLAAVAAPAASDRRVEREE
jgi:hypothetical protein